MAVPKTVLSSFETHDELHPFFWKDKAQLNPKVRKALLKIAQQFIGEWGLSKKTDIKDIRLTGSLAAYNYSEFSDIDLHIVVDYKDVDTNVEMVEKLFALLKSKWNNDHNIKIHDFEIEVYVENDGEDHKATGLYSILNDKWIKEPTKSDVPIDRDDINSKAKYFFDLYKILVGKYKSGHFDEVSKTIKTVKSKIKKMRQMGLDSDDGQNSIENIVFKVLRRTGLLGKYNNLLTKASDQLLLER